MNGPCCPAAFTLTVVVQQIIRAWPDGTVASWPPSEQAGTTATIPLRQCPEHGITGDTPIVTGRLAEPIAD